jgi:hypothetical protein
MYLAGIWVPTWQRDKLGEVRVVPTEFSTFFIALSMINSSAIKPKPLPAK